MRRIPLWARFTAVGVVLGLALLIGSNALSPQPQSDAQRAAALEATLKCPACQDLSVVQSSSPSSLAVRHEVQRDVAMGMSNEEIIAKLTGQYGNAVLLTPPAGGLSILLWLVPLALVLAATITIVLVLVSRKRAERGARTDPSGTTQ